MAEYAVADGDLIEVQAIGTLHGQTIRNVFHYRVAADAEIGSGHDFVNGVADAWASLGTTLIAMMSNEYKLLRITAQKVKPTRYAAEVNDVEDSGGVTENSLPSVCAAVISFHGILAQKRARGRHYFAGIPVSAEEDSQLSDGFVGDLQILGDMMVAPLEVPGYTGATLFLTPETPASYTGLSLYDYNVSQARKIIRVQRRREVGVGE